MHGGGGDGGAGGGHGGSAHFTMPPPVPEAIVQEVVVPVLEGVDNAIQVTIEGGRANVVLRWRDWRAPSGSVAPASARLDHDGRET